MSNEEKKSRFAKGSTDKEKMERFAAGGVISIISLVVGGLSGGLFWVMAMTRLLGPKDFGILGPVFNGFWMICTIASLGVNTTITTYVSHHYENEKDEAQKFMLEGTKILFILSLMVFVVFEIIAFILKLNHKIDATLYGIFAVVILGVSFGLLFWANNSILTGIQRLDFVAIGNLVFPVMMFVTSLVAVLIIQKIFGKQSTLDIIGAVSGLAIGNLAAYLVSFYLLQKLHSFPLKSLYSFVLHKEYVKKILKFGGWSAICLVGHNVLLQLSPTLVGVLANSFHLYGKTIDANKIASSFYNTAFIYGQAPMLLLGITIALIPAISEAQAQNKKYLMQKYYSFALKFSFGIIAVLVALYINCGGLLVQSFSGKLYPAVSLAPIIAVLATAVAFLAVIFLYLNLFIALKKPDLGAKIIILAIILEAALILAISLIVHNSFSVTFALLISGIIASLILINLTNKNFGLPFPFYTFIIPVGAALITIILGKFVFSPAAVGLGVHIVLVFLTYFIFYCFFGGYNSEEINGLINVVPNIKIKLVQKIILLVVILIQRSPFYEWFKE